jgi:hypothetical protein
MKEKITRLKSLNPEEQQCKGQPISPMVVPLLPPQTDDNWYLVANCIEFWSAVATCRPWQTGKWSTTSIWHHKVAHWANVGWKRSSTIMVGYSWWGGTGKSRVIQTVTDFFVRRDVKALLIKSAYTGIAYWLWVFLSRQDANAGKHVRHHTYNQSSSLSTLRTHLIKHHAKEWIEACDKRKSIITAHGAQEVVLSYWKKHGRAVPPLVNTNTCKPFVQENFEDAIIDFIIADDQVYFSVCSGLSIFDLKSSLSMLLNALNYVQSFWCFERSYKTQIFHTMQPYDAISLNFRRSSLEPLLPKWRHV